MWELCQKSGWVYGVRWMNMDEYIGSIIIHHTCRYPMNSPSGFWHSCKGSILLQQLLIYKTFRGALVLTGWESLCWDHRGFACRVEMPCSRKGGQWTSQRHWLHVLLPNLDWFDPRVCWKARKAWFRRRSRNSLALGHAAVGRSVGSHHLGQEPKEKKREKKKKKKEHRGQHCLWS